ncbi:MAG TPA: hypothetical protein VK348_13505 [Planctomycetota bacterium]|nr:hypothetical protein [Planctomycetota bacterium]
MRTLLLCLLPLASPPQAGAGFDAGVRAYGEGRWQDAFAAFTAAEQAAGIAVSAELLHDLALAALRAGRPSEAEAAAARAAARGGSRFAGLRDFVRGNAAWIRCERAELQASGPEAEPFAFDAAIALAETARNGWQLAAASRPDWPEARRNTERALQKIAELRQQQAAAERNRPPSRQTPDQPEPQPQPPQEQQPEPQLTELSPEQLQQLFDKLAAKEQQKLALRSTRQQAPDGSVERDW